MNTIQSQISPEAVTGFNRVALHESFVIFSDLEMVQQVRVVTVDENGVPIRERIMADENLNPAQKQNAALRYQDQIITKETRGAFVDMAGMVVPEGTEGAIPQKVFFQALTLEQLKASGFDITDDTPFSVILYALLGNEIAKINARGEL